MNVDDAENMKLLEGLGLFLMPKLFPWTRKQDHPLKDTSETGLDFRIEENSNDLTRKGKAWKNIMKWNCRAMFFSLYDNGYDDI